MKNIKLVFKKISKLKNNFNILFEITNERQQNEYQ